MTDHTPDPQRRSLRTPGRFRPLPIGYVEPILGLQFAFDQGTPLRNLKLFYCHPGRFTPVIDFDERIADFIGIRLGEFRVVFWVGG